MLPEVNQRDGLTKGRVWNRPCHDDFPLHVNILRMLLLLDSCGHTMQPMERLIGALLTKGGGARILATSRSPVELVENPWGTTKEAP
jgi:hypothetical protein